MVTGEKAICPTTRPSISATRDTTRALAARSAAMMNCSVWLLITKVANAATVTSLIAQRFPLDEARQAHEVLGKGGVTGKLVLLCNRSSPD